MFEVILSYLGNNCNENFFKIIRRIQEAHSPAMLVAGILVFYAFLSMKINHSKIISFGGKYSVGAYMIHGGAEFLRYLVWDGIFKIDVYYNKPISVYAAYYVFCVLAMFMVGVIVEFFYCHTMERILHKIYESFRIGKVCAWEEQCNDK